MSSNSAEENQQVLTRDTAAPHRSRKHRRVKKVFFVLLAVLSCALFTCAIWLHFTLKWALNTWANLSIYEILYTLSTPLEGTGNNMLGGYFHAAILPAIIAATIYTAVLVALTVVFRRAKYSRQTPGKHLSARGKHSAVRGRHSVPRGKHSALKGKHSSGQESRERIYSRRAVIALGATSVISFVSAFGTLERAWNEFSMADYFATDKEDDFVKQNCVNLTGEGLVFPVHKRNLIYIFLESMETTYADKNNGGAFEVNCIPELTQLAQQNECFSGDDKSIDGGFVYPGTGWTMGGMFAQTSGLPLQIELPDLNDMNSLTTLYPDVVTLGDILHQEGYRQALLIGSDAVFGGRKLYFSEHGDYEMRDYYYAEDEGWLTPDYPKWWGYEDEKLFEFAKNYLSNEVSPDKPFNLTILTADTHFEDGYICDLCSDEFGDNQYSNVFACSSRQVSSFVEWCTQQNWFEDTTIILSGDHLTMDSDFCSGVSESYPRRTYTAVINPAAQPVDTNACREYSTLDMFPTTLGALGVTIPGERLGLGTNLFSNTLTMTEVYGRDALEHSLSRKSSFLTSLSGM